MIQTTVQPPPPASVPRSGAPRCLLRAGEPLPPGLFETIRRRAVLEGCKWDPQVGDVHTLANFPLLMPCGVWTQLSWLAEQLASETLRAERELLDRPELLGRLGCPRHVVRALRQDAPPTPAAARVMRFDFHLTAGGWRVSEVNSDVPGGFTEASFFTRLMAEHYPGSGPAGLPMQAWAQALAGAAGPGGLVALLSAPGYMEDHQIMAYLAGELRNRGCRTHLAKPDQLSWRAGYAHLNTAWCTDRAEVLVRFYQAEWLPGLRPRSRWPCFFRGGRTPVANPGCAVISESKRLPLVWDRLSEALPVWRSLLPESRDPREVPWQRDPGWLLKSALSNTGDEVCMRELLTDRSWARIRWLVRLFPGCWVAQRRFESLPLQTPHGLRHACVGVYTVDGRAGGAYARLAARPLIDFAAVDAALLVEHEQ